jgi:CelD/BcsL family acetyltransferase involved in cellulose biosynthesis
MKLNTNIIRTKEVLNSIQHEWNALHSEIRGTVFQTFDWNMAWWEIYGTHNYELSVVTIWDEKKLVGVFPLFSEKTNLKLFWFRRLRFIGVYEAYGEYLPLIHSQYQTDIISALVNYFVEQLSRKKFDIISLFRFPPTSVFMQEFLGEVRRQNLKVKYDSETVTRIIMELPQSWEDYLNSISSYEKKMLIRRTRSLKNHGAEFEILSSPQELNEGFKDFVRLHNLAWEQKGTKSYFAVSNQFETFLQKVSSSFWCRNQLRLYFLRKDGMRFAAVHAFFLNDTCCFYLSGMDRNHQLANQSPGKVLLSYVIKDAISEGLKFFDFQGGEEEYKYRLGGNKTSFSKANIWKPGLMTLKVIPLLIILNSRRFMLDRVYNKIRYRLAHYLTHNPFLKAKST